MKYTHIRLNPKHEHGFQSGSVRQKCYELIKRNANRGANNRGVYPIDHYIQGCHAMGITTRTGSDALRHLDRNGVLTRFNLEIERRLKKANWKTKVS